ncbi:hypothetical protein BAU07_26255 (plasmid) [Bordetella flabilis]|uniref:Uncharacterized protein n=1 Tax=Bordetella flabilis TaxID=463014 RepID=A0A193GN26_9BORD|nr:hypothetical protein BAU07_26255 [Bordetella flabilis]
MAAYAAFLRWSANFSRNEITTHPSHRQIMMLSPVQSGRFAFTLEGSTILLGTQPFEAAWMAHMPFDCAYLSDRLYLCVTGVSLMEVHFPPIALGIHVAGAEKRGQLSQGRFVQPVGVEVQNGAVTAVGRPYGLGFPVRQGEITSGLLEATAARMRSQDMSRFF